MTKEYFNFPPPLKKALRSKFYRCTSIEPSSIYEVKRIFSLPYHNTIHSIFIEHGVTQFQLYKMIRYPIMLYAHYINEPAAYGHDTDNLIAWMLRAMKNNYLMMMKDAHGLQYDKKFKMTYKFIELHKEAILRVLETDARICAAKQDEIESQRPEHLK